MEDKLIENYEKMIETQDEYITNLKKQIEIMNEKTELLEEAFTVFGELLMEIEDLINTTPYAPLAVIKGLFISFDREEITNG